MQFTQEDGVLIITLEADRLDALATPAFKKELDQHVLDRPQRVILDASSIGFLDSTGLGAWVSLLKMMGEPGILAVVGAQPAVLRLLQITRLDRIFRLFDRLADAKAALAAG